MLGTHPFRRPQIAPDGTICDDVACHKCGYDLRTLRADARCPECGEAVRASIRGEMLIYADPGWVMRLSRGAAGILIGVAAVIIGPLAERLIGIVLMQAVVFLGTISGLVGVWMLTEPDPSGVGEDRYGGTRRLARWLPFLGLLSMILASLGALAPSLGWQVSRPLMRTLQVIAAYGGIGGMLAVMRYVRGLAMRMSYSWLVRAMEVDFNTMLFSSARTDASPPRAEAIARILMLSDTGPSFANAARSVGEATRCDTLIWISPPRISLPRLLSSLTSDSLRLPTPARPATPRNMHSASSRSPFRPPRRSRRASRQLIVTGRSRPI